MSDSGSVAARPRERNWLKGPALGCGALVVLLVCLLLGVAFYFRMAGAKMLESAVAKADRLDPGWRWEDLAARRATVPDEKNAALVVQAIDNLLPNDWLHDPAAPPPVPGDRTLWEEISELEPGVQLDSRQAEELRARLNRVQPALDKARALIGMRSGQYPAIAPELVLSSAHYQQPRRIAPLLWLDAALRAHDGRIDAALESSRGVLSAGCALGNENLTIPYLVRVACRRLAVTCIERTLAQGEPSEEALATAQKELQEELEQLLLAALRGERAWSDLQMEWMENGDDRLDGGSPGISRPNDPASRSASRVSMLLMGGFWTENRATRLNLMTEAVEIAKLPPDEQPDRFRALDQQAKSLTGSRTGLAALAIPSVIKVAEASQRSQADLRCAIAALAVERYRRVNGHWPDSLDQVVPQFLAKVPVDPYDRKPLRLKHVDDGVLVYSVGPDGKDDGGKIDRKNYIAPGTDMVFRLWNVQRRRQAPAE